MNAVEQQYQESLSETVEFRTHLRTLDDPEEVDNQVEEYLFDLARKYKGNRDAIVVNSTDIMCDLVAMAGFKKSIDTYDLVMRDLGVLEN